MFRCFSRINPARVMLAFWADEMPEFKTAATEATMGSPAFAVLYIISPGTRPVMIMKHCVKFICLSSPSPITLSTVLCLPTSSEKAIIVPSALKMPLSCKPPVFLNPFAFLFIWQIESSMVWAFIVRSDSTVIILSSCW